jgi:RNA polymerase sigma factor (TIGR02999 family)
MADRPPPNAVTEVLAAWNRGERDAFDRLLPLVIDELRRLARRQFAGERAGHTLQPTALINELYLRWSLQSGFEWTNRAHFFAVAGAQIRHLLVDHARRAKAGKRGGGETSIRLSDSGEAGRRGATSIVDLIDLDRALTELAQLDPQAGRIVELRYFAGLSAQEVAQVLGVTERTVLRRWAWARAWLHQRLAAEDT